MEHIHDLVIIGGGPAGYSGALYGARAGLDTVVVEKFSAGGQMSRTTMIDNYPGFEDGIDGFELGMKMRLGAERFGAETVSAEVTAAGLKERIKRIKTDDATLYGRAVLIATGAEHRQLGLERERELAGKGVSYCAACDGMLYRDKTAAVVGGGNSAAHAAVFLSRVCRKVILVHRRDELRAEKIYSDMVRKAENIDFYGGSSVTELLHEDHLTGIKIKNTAGEEKTVACDGVFICVGMDPVSKLFQGELIMDDSGYIVTDENMQTNIPGVFAAGDVRKKSLRQVITAAADGAVAAAQAEKYIVENEQKTIPM